MERYDEMKGEGYKWTTEHLFMRTIDAPKTSLISGFCAMRRIKSHGYIQVFLCREIIPSV